MATVTKTAPIFVSPSPQAPVLVANGASSPLVKLDLKDSVSAKLIIRIGRRVATALSRAATCQVRPTDNDTLNLPIKQRDVITQTATAAATLVATTAVAINDTKVTVGNVAGFAIGDTICLHNESTPSERFELAEVIRIASPDLFVNEPFRIAHPIGDRVTNLAEVREVLIVPPMDIYSVRLHNESGQALVYSVDLIKDPGETIT